MFAVLLFCLRSHIHLLNSRNPHLFVLVAVLLFSPFVFVLVHHGNIDLGFLHVHLKFFPDGFVAIILLVDVSQ